MVIALPLLALAEMEKVVGECKGHIGGGEATRGARDGGVEGSSSGDIGYTEPDEGDYSIARAKAG